MTVNELKNIPEFTLLNEGDMNKEITRPFCCDLLSVAMSKAPAGAAWVTIMGNTNALAVSSLTDCACIILAEGAAMDEAGMNRAKTEGITILRTQEGIFPASRRSREKRRPQNRPILPRLCLAPRLASTAKKVLDKSFFLCYYNKALRGRIADRNTGDAGKMLV